jgi:hypothetical protein
MPLSRVWYRVNKHEVPLNVVWLAVAVAFFMALTVNYYIPSCTRCCFCSSCVRCSDTVR